MAEDCGRRQVMEKIRIQGGKVFEEEGRFTERTLYIAGERIVTEEEYFAAGGQEKTVHAQGCYVIPGLTDIHFHGCVGYDCCDGTLEALKAMAKYELSQGITSITPATMTMPEEILFQVARAAAVYDSKDGADLCGLYMEGPVISAKKKGAQKEEYVRKPDVELFERLQSISGNRFRTVAVAPETEGAMDFIRALSGKARISLAHMTADYDTACEALKIGASQITHLYNAMPPFTHREPGPVAAAADDENCRVELICDGVHIHPAVVRTTFKIFGDDRVILISDSMRATGMPDGESELGGQTVFKNGRYATLADGTLAGSVTNLMDCVRRLVKEMGIPLESAIKCASANPAKAVGIYENYGSLTCGKYANVLILGGELELKMVCHHGEIV